MMTIDLNSRTYDLDSDGSIAASDVLVSKAINDQLTTGFTEGTLPVATNPTRLNLSHDGHLTA